MTPMTVLLADGQPIFLDGLRAHIESADDISVVSAVNCGADAIADSVGYRPDVAVLDIGLRCPDGLTAARRIGEHTPEVPVLMVTAHHDREQITAAMAAGAAGCVTKDADPEDILTAIRVVARGGFIVNGAGAAEVRRRLGTPAAHLFPQLTSREQEVLHLLVRDTDTRTMAGQLGITMKTVRNHVSNILVKLPARTRGEASRIARDVGL
jgi:DNA-binding NarL/FixJ family response regulator